MPGGCCLSSSRLLLYRAACQWIHTGPATVLGRKHGAQGANRRNDETDRPTVGAGTEGPADRKLTFEALISPQCVSVRQVTGHGIRWHADQVLAFVTHRHLSDSVGVGVGVGVAVGIAVLVVVGVGLGNLVLVVVVVGDAVGSTVGVGVGPGPAWATAGQTVTTSATITRGPTTERRIVAFDTVA